MNQEQELKLQAFFDGELPEAEAREMANWVAANPGAAALQTELKNTRQALSEYETNIKLPEPREFYWSKIERDIRKLEEREELRPVSPPFGRFLRFLAPASAFAVVLVVGLFAARNSGLMGNPSRPELETAMADPGAFTYHDEQEGTTLVWLSYGENGLANADGAATIQ
jgi:anti-sigma factor RsiW